jgi:hypothetical protein
MARVRTGNPNGRPPLAINGDKVDLHMHLPADIMKKIDRLRREAETRKDVIVRILREYAE